MAASSQPVDSMTFPSSALHEYALPECPICLEEFSRVKVVPVASRCFHAICSTCYPQLPKRACPTCEEPLEEKPAVATDLLKAIDTIRNLRDRVIGTPVRSHSPALELQSENAHSKVSDFVQNPWPADSTHARHLRADELEFVWESDRNLSEQALEKIYERLHYFYTDKCTICSTNNVRFGTSIFGRLSSIAARPKIAKAGNPYAQFCLGYSYYHGLGVIKSKVCARHWFAKAAQNGVPLAHYYLGLMHYHRQDWDKAFACFQKGVEHECLESKVLLARCYLEGKGCEKNFIMAEQLLTSAAAFKHIDSLVLLGDYYSQKSGEFILEGVKPNFEKAYNAYTEAISMGWVDVAGDIDRCRISYNREQEMNANPGCRIM